MLKRNWALIALVYLALAEALSLVPVPDLSLCLIQPEHDQEAADHDDKKYCPALHVGAALALEKVDLFLERHDKSVVGAFTIVLAVSTIGLWLATNKLWVAGERQLDHLSDTAERQLRSYIFAIQGRVRRFAPNEPIEVVVALKNTGQTPAYDVHHRTGVAVDTRPATFRFDLDWTTLPPKSTIGPGDVGSIYLLPENFMLSQANFDAIEAERAAVWVWGEIRYRDAFKHDRVTTFHFVYQGKAITDPPRAMAIDTEGNEAT